jgi:prefoldin subunit 5
MTAIEIIKERISLLENRQDDMQTELDKSADALAVIELKLILSKLEHTDEPVG